MAQLPVYVITDEQYARIEAAFEGDRDKLKNFIHNAVIDQVVAIEANKKRTELDSQLADLINDLRLELAYKSPTP